MSKPRCTIDPRLEALLETRPDVEWELVRCKKHIALLVRGHRVLAMPFSGRDAGCQIYNAIATLRRYLRSLT